MNETLQKINNLLKNFNKTFEISANEMEENGVPIACGLKIDNIKDDGSNFVNEMFETFNAIVKAVSDEHEIVYNQEKGLVVAKKIIKVDYIIEE